MKLVRLELYEDRVTKFTVAKCGAKNTVDARRCEGFEYANMSNDPKRVNCKHRDILGDGCNKYDPNTKEESKHKSKK